MLSFLHASIYFFLAVKYSLHRFLLKRPASPTEDLELKLFWNTFFLSPHHETQVLILNKTCSV
jgi:hypothetical protein